MNEESSTAVPGMRPAVGEPGIRWRGDGGLGGVAPAAMAAPWRPLSASVRIRALGYAIDSVILLVLGMAVAVVVAALATDSTATQEEVQREFEELMPLMYAIIGVIQFGYNFVSNTIGWSPGKRMVRLRIVREDGQAPGRRVGFLRTVGAVLSNLPLGLGYAWAIWGREHRTWHDRLSHTYVVREADLPAAVRPG